jgi:hypothetical protein
MEIRMSRTIRALSVLGGMAALGLAIAAPASASTLAAPASASAPAQAGIAFSEGSATGQSLPLQANATCASISFGVDQPVASYEVTNPNSTITFYANSTCTDPLPVIAAAFPGNTSSDFWLYAEGGDYYSSTTK